MHKRILLLTAILFFLLGAAPAGKSYNADRFDVNLDIQPDGSLAVVETIDFRFSGGPFTFVFRKIPTGRTDGIVDFAASMDGLDLPAGKEAGQVEIRHGNPIQVTWHFAPVSDATHRFVLRYRALGVVRQDAGADVLSWAALPDEYEYPIASTTVRLTWPSSGELLGPPSVLLGAGRVERGSSEIAFTAANLRPNSPLVVETRFARGSLITLRPQWQEKQIRSNAWGPSIGLGAIGLFAIGLLILYLLFRGSTRDASVTSGYRIRAARPPDELAPALTGVLNGRGPQWPNALATLFDLAQRGVLQIEELHKAGLSRSHDFLIRLQATPDNLLPHERGLLSMLFQDKRGSRQEVKLSELAKRLGSRWKEFSEPVKGEMEAAGFYSPERQSGRRRLLVVSSLLLAASIVLFIPAIILAANYLTWLFLVPAALFGVSIGGYIFSAYYSTLSDAGAREAARWQGFYEYLHDVTRGRENLPGRDSFVRYLPYAASYGLAEGWAKRFQKQGGMEIPRWFHALAGATDSDAGVGAFVAMTAAAGSAGGSSVAGGAAAGAAGGGASGAG